MSEKVVRLFELYLEKKGIFREVEDLQRRGRKMVEVPNQAGLHPSLLGVAEGKGRRLPASLQQA